MPRRLLVNMSSNRTGPPPQNAAVPGRVLIAPENWIQKQDAVKVTKDDLNSLVMNYLVIEGYKDAAESFSSECGLPPTVSDFASIQDRMEIRKCVQQGRIEEAIERVNDLDPEILDTNPDLYFRLQQQRLIEYIREDQVDEALEFAQEELAPRGEENPKFLKELERTLSLLAFDSRGPSPVQDLLSFSHRQKTAAELNSIILLSQSYETDPQLPLLLKLVVWTQDLLGKRVWFPKITNLATAALQDSTMSSGG